MHAYCIHCRSLSLDSIHRRHHDTEYGLHVDSDDSLFGRLLLEINQAGLSWNTILVKENNFRNAYSNYSIAEIAEYQEEDTARLMADTGIIRNKLKIHAAIHNAKQVLKIQKEFGSFHTWIKIQKSSDMPSWVAIFKKEFKFVGGEIVHEFLMTIGRIEGAHAPDCERYHFYLEARKQWLS